MSLCTHSAQRRSLVWAAVDPEVRAIGESLGSCSKVRAHAWRGVLGTTLHQRAQGGPRLSGTGESWLWDGFEDGLTRDAQKDRIWFVERRRIDPLVGMTHGPCLSSRALSPFLHLLHHHGIIIHDSTNIFLLASLECWAMPCSPRDRYEYGRVKPLEHTTQIEFPLELQTPRVPRLAVYSSRYTNYRRSLHVMHASSALLGGR